MVLQRGELPRLSGSLGFLDGVEVRVFAPARGLDELDELVVCGESRPDSWPDDDLVPIRYLC